MPQTSVLSNPEHAYPGLVTGDLHTFRLGSTIVDSPSAEIEPGKPVFRTTSGDRCASLPAAMVADPDAIKTNIGSTAGIQNLTTADFNGVIGAGELPLPAKVVLVLSNHANWDATTAVLSGLDENGIPVSENLSIPDTGNTTLTSTKYYSRVTGLTIPAQSGTSGTATLGYAADFTLDGGQFLGLSVRTAKTRYDHAATNAENYTDEEEMPVLEEGDMFVTVENAGRAGDVLHVRLIAAGAEKIGAFRAHDTDSGDCVPLRRLRLLESCSAGKTARARLRAA
jgi:hypothetical protein